MEPVPRYINKTWKENQLPKEKKMEASEMSAENYKLYLRSCRLQQAIFWGGVVTVFVIHRKFPVVLNK